MFNQVTLAGNLGDDPIARYTPSGVPVTNLNVACNERFTNAAGEVIEKTIWVKVVCWRRLAETTSQYLQKGSKVLIIGKLEPAEAYVGQDGQPRATIKVTADQVKFLSANPNSDRQPAEERDAPAALRRTAPAAAHRSPSQANEEAESNYHDQDIPF